jgi:hypothetical protein
MSETMNGKGGFSQSSDRYRDHGAALRPTAAPAAAPAPTPLGGSQQEAAVQSHEKTAGSSGGALPRALRDEVKVSVAPFGRRRIPPR